VPARQNTAAAAAASARRLARPITSSQVRKCRIRHLIGLVDAVLEAKCNNFNRSAWH